MKCWRPPPLRTTSTEPLRSAGPPPASCPVLLFNEKTHSPEATAGVVLWGAGAWPYWSVLCIEWFCNPPNSNIEAPIPTQPHPPRVALFGGGASKKVIKIDEVIRVEL